MTRGTAILITDTTILTHDEFNGDMYQTGIGQQFLDLLKTCNAKNFAKKMKEFNRVNYAYDDFKTYKHNIIEAIASRHRPEYIRKIDGEINVRFERNYFDNFFSDYIFLKNNSSSIIKVCTRTNCEGVCGPTVYIEPGKVDVFNFGRITEDKWNK